MREISVEILDELTLRATRSPRRRQTWNLHASYDEPCQRLLNAICVDSYIRPHRHMGDPKHELLVAVRGSFTVILFNEDGTVIRRTEIESGGHASMGVELAPRDWHTVVADVPGAVLLEIKAGPFDPDSPKELASWAPAEGSPEAAAYLSTLRVEK